MNKKKLMCAAVTAMVTILSTASIACASPLHVNAEAQKNQVTSNAQTQLPSSIIQYRITGADKTKAINAAEKAYSNYLGINIEEKADICGLIPAVWRYNDTIVVQYQPPTRYIDGHAEPGCAKDGNMHDYTVILSIKDYSLVGIGAEDFIDTPELSEYYSNHSYDQNKVKTAAINYLKNKGFNANAESITFDDVQKLDGIILVQLQYSDGSTTLVGVNFKDYSIVSFDHNTNNAK